VSDSATGEGNYPAAKVLGAIMCLALICLASTLAMPRAAASALLHSGDFSEATFVEVRTRDGSVVMSGELRSHVDSLGNVEKDAALLGRQQERVVGEIEIDIPRKDADDQRQELEIDVISLEPRTVYEVFVNDEHAATFTTDDRGSVDVELLSGAPRSY
jgi:hypothetical protein